MTGCWLSFLSQSLQVICAQPAIAILKSVCEPQKRTLFPGKMETPGLMAAFRPGEGSGLERSTTPVPSTAQELRYFSRPLKASEC